MKSRFVLTWVAVVFLLVGCQTDGPPEPTASTNNIPNFSMVEPGVWRGGRPDKAGWLWLQRAGVSNVIKLDLWEEEGAATNAMAMGMTVRYHPINVLQQLWDGPNSNDLRTAVLQIVPGSFVQCYHGQDRTGLAIAWHRLMEGTNKVDAYKEMKTHGFHDALDGLKDFWDGLTP